MGLRERSRWCIAAAAAAVAFVVTGIVTTRTGAGVAADDTVRGWVLDGLPVLLRQGLDRLARPLAIVALAPGLAVLALLALVRRSWRRAVVGVAVPALATLAAFELRVHDAFGAGGDGFPSDHAIVGMSLLVGAAVLWPRPLGRRALLVVAAATFAVGLGNVTWYAHRPRDVVGSALLVVAVAAATIAVAGGDASNVARPGVSRWSARRVRAPRRSPPR